MKKWIGLLFSLLCISMFSACSNQHQISAVFSLAEGMTYQEFYEGTFTKIMVTLGKQYFFCE